MVLHSQLYSGIYECFSSHAKWFLENDNIYSVTIKKDLGENETTVDVIEEGITKTNLFFNVQYYISYETYLHMMSKEHSYKNATIIYI